MLVHFLVSRLLCLCYTVLALFFGVQFGEKFNVRWCICFACGGPKSQGEGIVPFALGSCQHPPQKSILPTSLSCPALRHNLAMPAADRGLFWWLVWHHLREPINLVLNHHDMDCSLSVPGSTVWRRSCSSPKGGRSNLRPRA